MGLLDSKKPDNKNKAQKVKKEEVKTHSQKISDLLNKAKEMLEDSPQSVPVRGSLIHLRRAIGDLGQAGKFQKTSPTSDEE